MRLVYLQSLFYQDEGGLRATDERNKDLNTIYYLGVIDILTPFRFAKKVEGVWKGLRADRVRLPRPCSYVYLTDACLLCSTRSLQSHRTNTPTASSHS